MSLSQYIRFLSAVVAFCIVFRIYIISKQGHQRVFIPSRVFDKVHLVCSPWLTNKTACVPVLRVSQWDLHCSSWVVLHFSITAYTHKSSSLSCFPSKAWSQVSTGTWFGFLTPRGFGTPAARRLSYNFSHSRSRFPRRKTCHLPRLESRTPAIITVAMAYPLSRLIPFFCLLYMLGVGKRDLQHPFLVNFWWGSCLSYSFRADFRFLNFLIAPTLAANYSTPLNTCSVPGGEIDERHYDVIHGTWDYHPRPQSARVTLQ